MSMIELAVRVARNLWRMLGIGHLMAVDHERHFASCPSNQFCRVYQSFDAAARSIPPAKRVGSDYDEHRDDVPRSHGASYQSNCGVVF